MESTFCLSNCPRPTMPLTLNHPFTMTVKQTTKPHSNRSSPSLPSGLNFTRRALRNVFNNPVICAVERPSKDGKGDSKIVKGTVGASLALACALGIMSCSFKMNPKAIAGPKEIFQKAPHTSVLTQPIGGSLALKSFLDVGAELASSSSEAKPLYQPIFGAPPGPSMDDINAIKMEAVRIMKSGKPEEAVKMLRELYDTWQNEPEPAYNIEMALVEILIYQGKYEEALNCNCLKDEQRIPSDGRFPLYKAIICTMLNNEEARKWWEEFAAIVEGVYDHRNF